MPYFSIYAPDSGRPHYYTVTLIGYQRGLVVCWALNDLGWAPKVTHLNNIPEYNGSRLDGYHLVAPENIDAFALESMTNQSKT